MSDYSVNDGAGADDPEVELRKLDHINDPVAYEILIDGRIAGYATMNTRDVTIESASPANEWEIRVKNADLGITLTDSQEQAAAKVAGWVQEHEDDFSEVEGEEGAE
jgi:hypothetical protein